MALTSLHWQQPYASLNLSKETVTPVNLKKAPKFKGGDNFAPSDAALAAALTQGGHTPEWFSTQLGGTLWRMISHAGRLFLYISPHGSRMDDDPKVSRPLPDANTKSAAQIQLSQTLATLGAVEFRFVSADNCCGGRCRGCVETPHSSHHATWSLPVIPTPDGTTVTEPRQES